MFGAVGTGAHSYRIFNIAIVDVLLTVLAGYLLSWYFRLPLIWTVVALFLFGIIAHRAFCVRTTVDKLLFPDA
jgi:hypothetical protein